MNKKTIGFGLFVIFLVVVAIYATLRFSVSQIVDVPSGVGEVACTMEAKLCPDGSYVSRSGPKCEFAPCPVTVNKSVKLGQSIVLSGLKITPVKVAQDSRCPAGVMCIQAGTLIVKTKFERIDGAGGTKELDVELGKTVDVLQMSVNFDSASFVKDMNYSFTFVVEPMAN